MNTEALIERTDGPLGVASRVLRSRLGNLLLAVNLLLVSREILVECASRAAALADLGLFAVAGAPPPIGAGLLYALYVFLHIPTWVAMWLAGVVFHPFMTLLSYGDQHAVSRAAFVLLSSAQWLLFGHFVERRLSSPRTRLSVVPDVPRRRLARPQPAKASGVF